jgi:hypothetical protein
MQMRKLTAHEQEALKTVLEAADSYLEDLISGVEEGIYSASDNERGIERITEALNVIEGLSLVAL